MEKYILQIKTRTVISVLFGFLGLISACQQKHTEEKIQNRIPYEVIFKSLEFAFNDKFISRRISKGVYLEKNYLVQDIKPFRIGQHNISMIDSMKVTMKDPVRRENCVIEFHYLTIFGGEVLEIMYVLESRELYVKLLLEKKKGQWVVTKSEPIQI